MKSRGLWPLLPLSGLLLACVFSAPTPGEGNALPTVTPAPPAAISPPAETPRPTQTGAVQTSHADLVFTGGRILTMDPSSPEAEAAAVLGERIVYVGSIAGAAAYIGPETTVIDLAGNTLVPGFIDAHQHRIGDRWKVQIDDPAVVIDSAIEQGLTTIGELYVDEGRLEELVSLDQAGILRLRVNAYLPVNANSASGEVFEDYYQAYHPGQLLSPHVRVAGLKIFTDFDNANHLLWDQAALNDFVLARLQEGWPLAIKTISTRSLEMILIAVEHAAAELPDVPQQRVRLEHMIFATPEQIERIRQLGMVPVINLNTPGQLVGDEGIDQLIAREPAGAYTPWRSLVEAGVRFGSASGWPSYYVEEPTGAPFGSPIHLIYQAVTRVGNLGVQSDPALLDQAITAASALQALTVDGAYAAIEEDRVGSLTAGKLADMVVISDDPLRVSAAAINEIRVLVTMVGGEIAWCAAGSEALCPGALPEPAGETDPFLGTWFAVDPVDGSGMTLTITRSDTGYAISLYDDAAAACGLDEAGQPRYAAEFLASGGVDGSTLASTFETRACLSDPPTSSAMEIEIRYTYDSETDTLFDDLQGLTWQRQP